MYVRVHVCIHVTCMNFSSFSLYANFVQCVRATQRMHRSTLDGRQVLGLKECSHPCFDSISLPPLPPTPFLLSLLSFLLMHTTSYITLHRSWWTMNASVSWRAGYHDVLVSALIFIHSLISSHLQTKKHIHTVYAFAASLPVLNSTKPYPREQPVTRKISIRCANIYSYTHAYILKYISELTRKACTTHLYHI